jgi:hypothetical protein
MDSYAVNSPTNVTLSLRNIGVIAISLVGYNVTEPHVASFSRANWTEPMIGPNTVANVNILINGTAFSFQSGITYTIATTTTRNNIFTFTITG